MITKERLFKYICDNAIVSYERRLPNKILVIEFCEKQPIRVEVPLFYNFYEHFYKEEKVQDKIALAIFENT